MPGVSSIEWTNKTWNPVTGCTKVSAGCDNCYAERISKRFGRDFSEIRLHDDRLEAPLHWRKPSLIFVNSMSDLFHPDVPYSFVREVFEVAAACPQHTFQVLTKRPNRMKLYPNCWPANVWAGTSIENQEFVWRADQLRRVRASVRFLSLEPLIGPITQIDLSGIDWVIVGGESGPGHRPMERAWVETIRGHCHTSGVAFFFKQWGGHNSKAGGRVLGERTWDEMPNAARETPLISTNRSLSRIKVVAQG